MHLGNKVYFTCENYVYYWHWIFIFNIVLFHSWIDSVILPSSDLQWRSRNLMIFEKLSKSIRNLENCMVSPNPCSSQTRIFWFLISSEEFKDLIWLNFFFTGFSFLFHRFSYNKKPYSKFFNFTGLVLLTYVSSPSYPKLFFPQTYT